MRFPGDNTRQQGDIPDGFLRVGALTVHGLPVAKLLRFLENALPGDEGNGPAAVEDLGNSVPGKLAGICDILHGNSFRMHGQHLISLLQIEQFPMHIVTYADAGCKVYKM